MILPIPEQQLAEKRRTLGLGELQRLATEVCDTILGHAKQRFSFTKHLMSATLMQGEKFQQYNKQFPVAALTVVSWIRITGLFGLK